MLIGGWLNGQGLGRLILRAQEFGDNDEVTYINL